MENNTPPSKLDETVKDNLSNYDAKYDSGDWARMERMLDATPKSIAPKGSYNIAIIIGGIVLVGGFAIYKGVTSSKTTTDTTTEIPVAPIENKVETAPKPLPAPVVTNTLTTTTPIVKEEPKVVPEVKKTLVAVDIKEKVVDGERSTYVMELILAMRKQGWLWTEEFIWHKKNSYPGKWPNRWVTCLPMRS